MTRVVALLGALALAACSEEAGNGESSPPPAAERGGEATEGGASSGGAESSSGGAESSSGGAESSSGGGDSDAGAAGEPSLPVAGNCALEEPAFCDTFEDGPHDGGRSGELDPNRWSVLRGVPTLHADLGIGYEIQPALMPECRPEIEGTRALPEADTLICEPTATIASRHLLGAVAAQNYGLNAYRIRQPFDFADRTGTIALDVDLSANGLGGWSALAISEDPSPGPSYDFPERGSGARNGVQIEFNVGWCSTPNTVIPSFFSSRDFLETAHEFSWDCDQPHAVTAPGSLNHVEIRVNQDGVEIWASDASPDGVTFPNFQRIGGLALPLSFTRGSVSLIARNHATLKYWVGASWLTRWDNVGFDGPAIFDTREYSVPEPLEVTEGLPGCQIGDSCVWRGQAIADNPGDPDVCATECEAEGEGRTVGYVVPIDGQEEPVALEIPNVSLEGATAARLVLAADYPWFDWNGVFPEPTALALRYRLNGNASHDRFVSELEVNAFGGEQAGAGLLNQLIELDPSELVEGTNVLELSGVGTWTGAYRIAVVGVDLALDVQR